MAWSETDAPSKETFERKSWVFRGTRRKLEGGRGSEGMCIPLQCFVETASRSTVDQLRAHSILSLRKVVPRDTDAPGLAHHPPTQRRARR